ncbi:MAG: hypothetical protein WB493_10290 [Anaeromyxobacteraceae bacterium]
MIDRARGTTRILAVALAAFASSGIAAAQAPTDPEKADKECQEIGESPSPSLSAEERRWFGEACTCRDPIGCGYLGSARWEKRNEAERKKEADRVAAEKKELDQAAAEATREAREACTRFQACLVGKPGEGACQELEAPFEYDCAAGLRDHEACGQFIAKMREQPAKIDCAATFR